MTGRLQVFFEGSWSQVCATEFEAPDASVACRQLGYGAGTVIPQFLLRADRMTVQTTEVFPEIGISASGCSGSEDRLLDCTANNDLGGMFNRDCLNSDGFGLVLACVRSREAGLPSHPITPLLSCYPPFPRYPSPQLSVFPITNVSGALDLRSGFLWHRFLDWLYMFFVLFGLEFVSLSRVPWNAAMFR